MIEIFLRYHLLIDAGLLALMLALSQYVVLKAGVFSVATVGIAALSAYTTAICQAKGGLSPTLSVVAGTSVAILVAAMLAIPLSRLRGVTQAIATLSFVIVVQSCILIFEELTGGAAGFHGIPKTQSTISLAAAALISIAILYALGRITLGKAFDALRQDEIAAASHGVSVRRYQFYAIVLSGLFAGVAGGLIANYSYSLVPEQFDFQVVVNVLTYTVIGGVARVGGPVFGTAFLIALPEVIRPLASERLVVNGVLLILISIYLPAGIVDTVANVLRSKRASATSQGAYKHSIDERFADTSERNSLEARP